MGYSVRAEVKNCDVLAVRGTETVVIELKKSFNITLVYQLMQRQTITSNVYAAIPRPDKGARERTWKSMVKLCERLDFGLITVAVDSPLKFAEIICSPSKMMKITNYRRKKEAENEVAKRSGDFNLGGSTRRKIITAYREKSIELLCLAEKYSRLSGSLLKELGYEPKAYSILYKNYYKWFEKAEKGVYCVSETGRQALDEPQYSAIVKFYRESFKTKSDVE